MSQNIQMDAQSRLRLAEPGKYKVVIHNDDFTPMDFVVEVLIMVFHKSQEEALRLMMEVHRGARAVAGVYAYDIACTKAERAVSLAREQGFPFRVTVEE